jgi:hypothetical protein
MRIDRTGISSPSFLENQEFRVPTGQELSQVPSDGFSPQGSSPVTTMKKIDASLVLNARGLDKQSMDYRIKSFDTAPDGTTFVIYEAKNAAVEDRHPGYLSRITPQGEIWEAPIDDKELCAVKAGPDGTSFVQTKEHIRSYNADGTLRFDHTFEEPVNNHFMDSKGNHYFVSSNSREFYVIDKDGRRAEIPEAMKGVKSHQVIQASPDEFYARDGSTIVCVDVKSGKKSKEFTYKDPAEPKQNLSRYIDHFEVDRAGNVKLWITNSYRQPAMPMYDDFHFGIGGMRRWGGMPHPPMDDRFYQDTYINDMSLEQVDDNGKTVWKAESLGADPTKAMLPDGSVLYTNNREELVPRPADADPQYVPSQIGSGKVFVGKIGPGGTKDDSAFKVEGKIRRMLVDSESGTVIMSHGKSYDETVITEFNAKGEALRTHALPRSDRALYPERLSGKNQVILQDSEREKAYSLDMESGKLTCLTDTATDHSYKVLTKELAEDEELKESADALPGSEEFDEWITIGGVKLPKKSTD